MKKHSIRPNLTLGRFDPTQLSSERFKNRGFGVCPRLYEDFVRVARERDRPPL
jgi:hypothetical protein